jgi:hypothetical protein
MRPDRQAIPSPPSQVLLRRGGRRFIWRGKLSGRAFAPLPFTLKRTTKRVLRSTKVPADEQLKTP